MTLLTVDRDQLLDTAGLPVRAEVSTIVRALDRLLTVAGYYAADHEQYLRASEAACAAMTAAMHPLPSVAFEVSASGLVVDGTTIEPRQKAARQIHDLLVTLDIARLSVSARLTAADLRRTLAALQAHRQARLHAQSFRTLTIADLPPTVSADSCRVREYTPSTGTRDGGGDEIDGLLGSWSESTGPAPAAGSLPAGFPRELMAMLASAAKNQAGDVADDESTAGACITEDELAEIRAGVERLLQRDPGARAITALMDLARRALEFSGDPDKARLVFGQLRRRLDGEDREPAAGTVQHREAALGAAELTRRIAELAARPEPLAEPLASARRDQLAIGFHLLGAGGPDHASAAAGALLADVCGSPELGAVEAAALAEAMQDLARRGLAAEIDHAMPPLLARLRVARPDLLVHVWNGLDPQLEAPALALLWPHLVNDLALGLEPATEPAAARCCQLAGALDLEAALRLAPRFLSLPGAARTTVSDQAFLVPPLRARGMHAVLLQGAASARHGLRLWRELQHRPPDRLTRLVIAAFAGNEAADVGLLQTIIREAGTPRPSAAFGGFAAALLTDALEALPRKRRTEAWTAEAVAWLAANAPARANELLRRVARERSWLLLPSWPKPCRTAARAMPSTPAGPKEP
ncbi:MAG: hypothetical protein IPK64_15145 [bacterium]|nr:hypothetical protein [bacterium]